MAWLMILSTFAWMVSNLFSYLFHLLAQGYTRGTIEVKIEVKEINVHVKVIIIFFPNIREIHFIYVIDCNIKVKIELKSLLCKLYRTVMTYDLGCKVQAIY